MLRELFCTLADFYYYKTNKYTIMKKTTYLFLWFLLSLGLAGAQNSLSILKMNLKEDAAYRQLGNSATLLLQNAEGLRLNDLLLLTDNLNDTVRLETSYEYETLAFYLNYDFDKDGKEIIDTVWYTGKGNTRDTIKSDKKYMASIPSQFYFGKKQMKKAGITADGMVFFSENDSIRPHSDKWDYNSIQDFGNRGIYNYIYFALLNVKEFNSYLEYDEDPLTGEVTAKVVCDPEQDKTIPTPLFATDATKIGYEINGDTLFIGYENIRLVSGFDAATHDQTVSWNYQINLKTGEIGLQTKGFFTDPKKDTLPVNMKWGLVTEELKTAWLKDFNGISEILPGMSSRTLRMGNDTILNVFGHPVENAIYQFVLPDPCVEVTEASITWAENLYVTSSEINITNQTIWTKGQKALFVLSKHQTLSGENLPQDGVFYQENDDANPSAVQLGDGQAIVAKMLLINNEDELEKSNIAKKISDFNNLEPATDYYIHTFVFNDTCTRGPLYGNALPAKKVTTLLENAGEISVKDITVNSMKVVLPEATEGLKYILALATQPVATSNGTHYMSLLKNGTTYTEGQELKYVEEGYLSVLEIPFTIAKVGVTGTVELTGLETGTGYRVMVWLMKGEGENLLYSVDYAESTGRTHYIVPTDINFRGEEVSSLPIGWESSCRTVWGFDETTWMPVEKKQPHFCVQYTTMTGGEILSAMLEEKDRNIETDLVNAHAITPWIDKGDAERILTSFSIRFFRMVGESIFTYRVREGDSVIISYQETGDTQWTRIAFCDNKTEYSWNGSAEIKIPFFRPTNTFRYRIDYYHETSWEDDTAAFFSIYDFKASSLTFPAVTDLHSEHLTDSSVTIAWEGEADEYRLLWKKSTHEGDYDTIATTQTSHDLKNLTPKTTYAYRVYGIYEGENGIISPEMYFTTPDTIPFVLDTVKIPVFSLAPGAVDKGSLLIISCATDKATVYYTTDGSTPSAQSKLYETALSIDSAMTIKAIAIKDGMIDSKVAEATYTLKGVANEQSLLAGVKLYPNPTDGHFNVIVPEAAVVEVIATNGTLVKRLDVAAGQTTLQLNGAGIYFVKVSINGQVAVRKIVVR